MGFLLGLSVIGLITILEKLLGCVLKNGKSSKENDSDENDGENPTAKDLKKNNQLNLDGSRY
jgi:hypothetical protein